MATFYLDFENGDDSKDGTTFANRWKTITNGATAARTAPGDTIRMMKSPDPVSLGVNGTFTNKSATITLASAKTANISLCTAGWTASANVTSSTSTTRKEGSVSTTIVPATAFTTGMMGYEATGTLDLSAYNKVSFWIQTSSSVAANTLRLDLCSDTAGATPVHSFTITNALTAANIWSPQTFDNGSSLSSSIKSVALTALTDPGTPTILIDNIFACNDLHLQSLIGTSSSATDRTWYPVRSVNGTTVTIDTTQPSGANSNTSVGFSEATTTTTAYTRAPIRVTSTQTFNEAGTATARITYSGGWDRTNMTSQNGMTVLFGDQNNVTTSLLNMATLNYINVERVGTLHGTIGLSSTGITKVSDSFFISGSSYSISALTLQNVNAGATGTIAPISFSFGPCSYDNIYVYTSGSTGIDKAATQASLFGTISNSTFINTTFGIGTTAANSPNQNFTLNNVTIKDCTSALVRGTFKINGFTATGNSASVFNNCNVDCNNITYTGTLISVGGTYNFSRFSTYAGAIYSGTTLVVYDVNTPLHGSASRSWRHDVQASSDILNLIDQPLQGFAVGASTLVTFKIWIRRTSTSVTGRVRLKGYTVAGVDADVTATSSAAINTWEELSITFTPSAAGVAVIDLESYTTDGNTGSVFFGDATVTQA